MPEVLRDLVVSLSLKTDNFTRNINSINRQIREAESAFRLAGAGIDNFGNTTAGMSSRLSMLNANLGHQRDAVGQYERVLAAANTRLQESHARYTEYSGRLDEARTKHRALGDAIKDQEAYLREIADLCGTDCDAYRAEAEELDRLKTEYAASSEEVKKLEGQCQSLQKAMQRNADAVSKAQTDLNNAQAAVRETEAEIRRLTEQIRIQQSAFTQAGAALTAFSTKMTTIGRSATQLGRRMTLMITTPIVAMGKKIVQASLDFESSFAYVRKTVKATEEQYDQLAEASKRLSTQIATSTSEINHVMSTGGQLGIATEHIEEFSRVMIDLANASTDLDADTAATNLAKFANIMNTDQSLFKNIGSTVAELGNNFATTEEPIVTMAMRIAGAGKQVGLTEAQVLGLAAALSSIGIQAQAGGSSISKALIKMEVAARTGGDELEDFAKVSGMTAKEFVEQWGNDPVQAFQKFIEGLAKMDDEGISAVKTLNDIGIKEIRLRDTLLRATNANELFARAQQMANNAWRENTALDTMAAKKYATLASRLTNLKNKAVLFAQTLGNDMRPTIERALESVSGFIGKLEGLDSSQRLTLLGITAAIAAAGPVILIIGHLATGIGKVTGVIGTFCTAVGQAGGGLSGLMSVLGSSPAVWLAVGAGIIYATVKLADWITGAKAAREAQEQLNAAVEKWAENVTTAYEKSKGLTAFGLTPDDFSVGGGTGAGGDWLSQTIDTWSDGKKETDKIVNDTVKGFTDGTDKIRTALGQLKDSAGGTALWDLTGDLDALDAIDKEVEAILKKKQNGLLTDDDKARLQQLMDQREAIRIKYKLVADTEGGFGDIVSGVEAALSRGANNADVFSDAFAAATQGMGAFIGSLNAEYDARYKVISAMEDGEEKEKALAELHAWYMEQKTAATEQYYNTLQQLLGKTGMFEEGGEFSETVSQLETINELMKAAAGKDEKSEEMNKLREALAGLDETSVVELESAISAMEAAAADAGTTVPDEVAKAKEALDAVKQAAIKPEDLFPEDVASSISEMFTGLADEVHEVYATLNCDNLSKAYDAWAAGTHADIIPSIDGTAISEIGLTGNITSITKEKDVTFEVDGSGRITNAKPTDKVTFSVDGDGNVTSVVVRNGVTYTVDGTGSITSITPKSGLTYTVDGTGQITGLTTADGVTFTTDGTGKITSVTADGVTFTADGKGNITAVNPAQGVTFEVNGKGKITNAEPDDQVSFSVNGKGKVTSVVVREGVTYTVDGKGNITSVTTAEGVTYTLDGTGKVTKVTTAAGVTFSVDGKGKITSVSTAQGVSYTANGNGVIQAVALAPGAELPVVELEATVTKVTELEMAASKNRMDDKPKFGESINLFSSTQDKIDNIRNLSQSIDELKKKADELRSEGNTAEAGFFDENAATQATELGNAMKALTDVDLANIGAYMGKLVAALQSGEGTPDQIETWNTELESLTALLAGIDPEQFNQTGTNIVEGIAQGMTGYAFEGDAATVAAQVLAACNAALGAHSPATTMVPTGSDVAEGIGQGMTGYDFSSDAGTVASKIISAIALKMTGMNALGSTAASGVGSGLTGYDFSTDGSTLATNLKSAASDNIDETTLKSIGTNAMSGMAAGIRSGQNSVVTAMRNAAKAAVKAAKDALKIESPSKVFRDEVGVMAMRGFGSGIEKETEKQAQIIRNAARFLTGEAQGGIVAGSTHNDNRQTITQQSSVNLTGNSFYVRSDQDIHDLAVEIATLTRTQQRGRGLRMA